MTDATLAEDEVDHFDDLSELLKTQCVVEFRHDGKLRKSKLKVPTVDEVLKARQRFLAFMGQMISHDESVRDESADKAQVAKRGFEIRVELERQSADWLKIVLPEFRKVKQDEVVRFIRRVSGGIHSPLVLAAKRLCGIEMIGTVDSPF